MRIALVHEFLTQYGGAERVLEAFHEIWPDAPLYTIVYDEKKFKDAFSGYDVRTSFLQKFPCASSRRRYKWYLLLMPRAVESFDLSDYDVILSDSSAFAKGIIKKPSALHICYCHTPTRYLWGYSKQYVEELPYNRFIKKILPHFLKKLRKWDFEAAQKVDKFIANSENVKKRIKKYYNREADVIYPPVDTKFFRPSDIIKDYYFMVTRLEPYKKVNLVIDAFNKLKLPLKIAGTGTKAESLKKHSNSNIEFLGWVSDSELKKYYSECKTFILPQEEDAGITQLEAMASGRPVIAYKKGGALETIKEGVTGIFFEDQTPESLIDAIEKFDNYNFNQETIRKYALQFDKEIFKQKIKDYVTADYAKSNRR